MQVTSLPRAALYRRISETDDEFDKVENQGSLLRPFCARNGYEVVEDYCDDGISAYRDDVTRPQWERLLADIPKGRFDVIVATFENRLTRQIAEKVQLLGLCKTAGVSWHTLHEGLVDPCSDDQILLAIIKGWQAQSEISGRVKAQKQRFDAERAAGNPLWGVRPFGFEEDRRQHHPTEADDVRWAYGQVLEGRTLYSIMKAWNERGITTTRHNRWSYATVKQLLRRESNIALYNGTRMKWDPIVPKETFDAVQALLQRPERAASRQREPRWLMAGIVRCGTCGAPMRSALGSDRKSSWPVYRCSSTMSAGRQAAITDDAGQPQRHASIKCSELDPQVRSAVASAFMFAPTDFLPGEPSDAADLRRAQAGQAQVRASLERVAEAADDPNFPLAVLKEKAAALRTREAEFQATISEITQRSAQASMLLESRRNLFSGVPGSDGVRVSLENAVEHMSRLEARFDTLPLHQRRTLVQSLLDVRVQSGRRPERILIEHLVATSLNGES